MRLSAFVFLIALPAMAHTAASPRGNSVEPREETCSAQGDGCNDSGTLPPCCLPLQCKALVVNLGPLVSSPPPTTLKVRPSESAPSLLLADRCVRLASLEY